MKRTLSVVVSAVLVLAMMLSLTACGQQSPAKPAADPIVGTWEGEADFAAVYNEMFSGIEEYAVMGFEVKEAKLKLVFTFNEDNSMTMKIDEESLRTMAETLVVELLESTLKTLGLDMTVEEYLVMAGMDMSAMIDSVFSGDSLTQGFDGLNLNGTYKVDGNKLHLIAQDDEFDAQTYTPFTITGNTMVMETPVGELLKIENGQKMMDMMFPLTLTKTA